MKLARWTDSLSRSALEEMLVRTASPDVLSLALGLPAPELFPREGIEAALASRLTSDPRALQYGPPLTELRAFVSQLMARRGVRCRPEQIFLTAGAQQGMSLLTRLLIEPGATVAIESLCYSGFTQCLAPLSARAVVAPLDAAAGVDLDALEALFAHERPALFYTQSDGHNPLGTSLSPAARERLVALARAHRVPILEDDAYGFLQYEDDPHPALRALDEEWVIYLGSFSKTLAPALRTGWLVVPEAWIAPLSSLKESSDINCAPLGQRAIESFVATGGFDPHLARLRAAYRERRDALLAAIERHFPADAHWSSPRAGFFVWVELDSSIDTTELLRVALEEEKVAFVPGGAFATAGSGAGAHALRLNLSLNPPALLEEGVARIARALERQKHDTRRSR
ncbi:MAG: PLP-dependent aminotransferase family protein [Candidatus Eisenbacteria bacterium]